MFFLTLAIEPLVINFHKSSLSCSKYLQVFEVLHYVGSCIIKVLKLKVKRVKSVWEADESRLRKKKPEHAARVARIARIRAHGSNPMGSEGLNHQGSDPQEMMRPFLEQISESKENGSPAVILETELPRSRFLLASSKRVDSFRKYFMPGKRAFCSLNL